MLVGILVIGMSFSRQPLFPTSLGMDTGGVLEGETIWSDGAGDEVES